ncbi:conserved hypothetical protein [Crenothrix polyspora]|uniref:BrnA antitoxin of type II toxin-antitoxin system n=1 Tax=Crenothrix polyspora TaxID=360316 RepID=A0A1R4HE12_9GAMM|nr:BrnA antitoxin family protein [Crenothrix polyspora]SJM94472.1 conserved hypothetical protein [Crenothrix polyspora]
MNVKHTTDTQTDWAKLARRDDNEIDYSDAPALSSELRSLRIRQPDGRTVLINNSTIEIDADVLAWFKTHSVNYQDHINQLLRNYIKHELVE